LKARDASVARPPLRTLFGAALCALGLAVGATALAQEDASKGSFRDRMRQRLIERQQAQPAPQGDTDAKAPLTKPGDYTVTIEQGGLKRAYKVHVPVTYRPATPAPLLVAMHGGGGSMDLQASDAHYGLISKSDREGFVVVFPNGFSQLASGKFATWNAGNCCAAARDRNADDVGFIRQMVENLFLQLNIDRQKVFATGMSNGGLMAHRLACEASDLFKAIAPVAGTDNTKTCTPTNPVSVLLIHARDDDHVLFNGGAGKPLKASTVTDFTSVPETVSRWVGRNGCTGAPQRVLEVPGAYCDRYVACQGGARVELCVTETGGHSWPGGTKARGNKAGSTAISADDVMWDFFMGR